MSLRQYSPNMPWVVVRISSQYFAIATEQLKELIHIPEVSAVPDLPDFVRGVVNIRGQVAPMLDLRKRLGLPSAAEEAESFCRLMEQREQDHRAWLDEMEASLRERRPFKLATDPHQCAFGKWYDTYRPNNAAVQALLAKFDEPHKRIHEVGAKVAELERADAFDRAVALAASVRQTELSLLLSLFAEVRAAARNEFRELAAVLRVGNRTIAASVDEAVAVEKLFAIQPLPSGAGAGHNGAVARLAKRPKSEEIVLLLETERLLDRENIDRLLSLHRAA